MKSNLKQLVKDTFVYGLSTILAQILSLILVPFYTQELDPVEYGIISLVTLSMNFLMPLGGLGLESALFRYFAKSDDRNEHVSYFTSASIVKMVTVLMLITLIFPFYRPLNEWLFDSQLTYTYFILMLITFLLDNISSLAFVVLRAERKVTRIATLNIIVLVTSLAVSIYLVLILKMGVMGVLIARATASFVKAVLFMRTSLGRFNYSAFNWSRLNELLHYGIPLVPHKIQSMVISLFTLFIINNKLGLVAAGLYAVAKKFAKPLQFVVTMVQQAWSPYKFQIHREESKPESLFRNLISAYWLFLLAFWTVFCLFVPELFRALINEKYWSAIPYVPFLTFLAVIEGVRFTINTGFELSEKQIKASVATFYSMVIIVVCSLLTIDFYQPYGFFVAQGLAYGTTAYLLYRQAKREMTIKYPFRVIGISLVASVVVVALGAWAELLVKIGLLISYLLVLFFILRSIYGNSFVHKLKSTAKPLKQ